MVGKICAITGAASGIGKALMFSFADEGYKVIGVDNDVEGSKLALAELKSKSKCEFVIADLSDKTNIDHVVANLPKISVFIHCAGISAVGCFEEVGVSAQIKVLDINLLAPMLLTKKLLQEKKVASGSSLVFISSLSHFVSYPSAVAYAASKSGLASYARSLRVALVSKGIQVLTVYPGPTRTPHARKYSPDNSREHHRMPPEKVAQATLCSVNKKHRILIIGIANKVFATLGFAFPSLTEMFMHRMMLNLEKP